MANIHSGVLDDGAKLQVVPSTRRITVPASVAVIGTEGDHRSEQLTFQCPSVIDGHDVTACASHYISWVNAAGKGGRFPIEDIWVDDNYMYFHWMIDDRITTLAGGIKFAIHFVDYGENGLVLYKWSTTTCTDLMVLETTNHDTDDEDDAVLYVDINDTTLENAVGAAVGGILNG